MVDDGESHDVFRGFKLMILSISWPSRFSKANQWKGFLLSL